MKCSKCGFSNKDGSKYCGNCGNDLSNVVKTADYSSSHEKTLFCIMGFLFPIIGIIIGCIYSKKDKGLSKSIIISATISICLKVLLFVIFFVLFVIGGIVGNINHNGKLSSCRSYCGYNYRVVNDTCTCKDGTKYDLETGRKLEDDHGDNGSKDDNHGDNGSKDDNIISKKEIIIDKDVTDINMINWKRDINEGKKVITVIASSTCPHCKAYKPVIEDMAKEYNLLLYFFETDQLSVDDYEVLTSIDSDKFSFSGSVPFTFIISNNEYIADKVGYSDVSSVINFLNDNGYNISKYYTYENDSI